jgi:hypothetical protein
MMCLRGEWGGERRRRGCFGAFGKVRLIFLPFPPSPNPFLPSLNLALVPAGISPDPRRSYFLLIENRQLTFHPPQVRYFQLSTFSFSGP